MLLALRLYRDTLMTTLKQNNKIKIFQICFNEIRWSGHYQLLQFLNTSRNQSCRGLKSVTLTAEKHCCVSKNKTLVCDWTQFSSFHLWGSRPLKCPSSLFMNRCDASSLRCSMKSLSLVPYFLLFLIPQSWLCWAVTINDDYLSIRINCTNK